VSNNSVIKDGAGIDNNSSLTLQNESAIVNNSAGRSGGGIFNEEEFAVLTIDETSIISDNVADADEDGVGTGGGLRNETEASLVSHGSIIGNECKADLGCGGGVLSDGTGIVDIAGIVSENHPDQFAVDPKSDE
jgi:hypothetical protein